MKPLDEVIRDFDAIAAEIGKNPEEFLTPVERALLSYLPESARAGLDVGCGAGLVTRTLARRGIAMTALDISPGMIETARAHTDPRLDIRYLVGDVTSSSLPAAAFDVVISISVAHHVPLDEFVPRLASLVAPGGKLLIQDVTDRDHWIHAPLNAIATVARIIRRKLSGLENPLPVRRLLNRHGRGEKYLKHLEAERAYRRLLPGARVRHHLEWRYSVIWRKPSG